MSGLLVARRGSLHRSRAAALDYATEVAADNPFAWWRMSETTGSTVADEVGTNDGTVFGANLNVAGASGTGSAASFDGTDDYINVGTLGSFGGSMGSGSTFEAWAKWSGTGGPQTILGSINDGVSTLVRFWVNSNEANVLSAGRVALIMRNETGDWRARATSGSSYNDGGWHHIAGTWAGGSAYPSLYVDGTLDNGSVFDATSTSSATANFDYPICIGAENVRGTVSAFLAGDLDEVALYTSVLSASRIQAHYNAGVA